jgi:hypothetical protein
MSKTVFKYDKTALDNLQKFIEANHYVKIGVLSISPKRPPDKKTGKSIDAVVLAAVHEFGSPSRKIPERSFLRKTMAMRKKDFNDFFDMGKDKIMKLIMDGNGDVFLNKVGAKWVGYVHETFAAQGPGWKDLSDRRIAERSVTGRAKGNKDPEKHSILWDTGAMLRSIIHEVV